MANALYDTGRNAFATGDIDWVNDIVRVYLIDANDYTVDLVNHQYLTSVAGAARVAFVALAGKTASAGVCDATDAVLSSVTGDISEALLLVKWAGADATSQLIAYMDTGTGLPVTPNGGDITITWDNGSNKIFKL